MGALLDRFGALGVRFDRLPGDQVRAHGVLTDELRAAIRVNKPALLTELVAANESTDFRWRVAIRGREPFEVRVVPEATATQMQAQYPGASIAALSAASPRPATQAEEAELRMLVETALADADDADRAEALAVALGDPGAALLSLRTLGAGLQPDPPRDLENRNSNGSTETQSQPCCTSK